MVKNIILNNFQLHDYLTLDFSAGVNVLIGETDSGKSAIIRALNLALNNVPRGGEKIYLRDGATEPLSVIVSDDKGNTIERKNRTYLINDEVRLAAFKSDKPEALSQIIHTNEINFQLQIEPHFLILETGGNAAKILNSVTGMEDQMLCLSETKSRLEITRRKFKELAHEKEGINQKVNQLEFVPDLLNQLRIIQKRNDQLVSHQHQITQLHALIEDLIISSDKQEGMQFLDEFEMNFLKIFALALGEKARSESIDSLAQLITLVYEGEKKIVTLSELTNHELHVSALHDMAVQLKVIRSRIDALAFMLNDIKEKQQVSFTLDFEIDEYRSQFDDLMLTAGACPFCGAVTKKGGHKC